MLYLPSKRHGSGPVGAFFDQRLVELSPGPWVDDRPALFTVILQARDISAEEGCKFATTASPVTLVAHLIVQDIRLDLHLREKIKIS